jgi:hypothetical protein
VVEKPVGFSWIISRGDLIDLARGEPWLIVAEKPTGLLGKKNGGSIDPSCCFGLK